MDAATTTKEPREFGRLLKDSADLVLQSPVLYAQLVLIGVVPAAALTLLVPATRSKEAFSAAWDSGDVGVVAVGTLGALLGRVLDSFLGVAAIAALAARTEGRAHDLKAACSEAWTRFWPYLTTGLLALLWILGGTLLFIVPGLILALRYTLIPYAVLVEGREGGAALERSSQLCRARPWKVYGNLIGAAFVIVLTGAFVSGLAGAVTMFLPDAADQVVAKAVDGLAGVWLAGFAVLLYKDVAKVVE